jgi:hypothetical protein
MLMMGGIRVRDRRKGVSLVLGGGGVWHSGVD